MEHLEKLRQWLQSCPVWDSTLSVDYTPAKPANAGLYPGGLEQVSRREDLLGNVTVENRYHFTLYCNVPMGQDNTQQADRLLQLQNWVQQQSALGLAPVFGDVPAREQLRAERGQLKKTSQIGTGRYGLSLTAEFIKVYNKENDYGKN